MSAHWIRRDAFVCPVLVLVLAVAVAWSDEPTPEELQAMAETYLESHRGDMPRTTADLRTSLLEADEVVIYAGLPREGTNAYRTEMKRDDVLTVNGYAFYAESVSCKADTALLKAVAADELVEYWSQKLCGGFHPDYMIAWKRGEVQCTAMICFGCRDIFFTEGERRYRHGMTEKPSRNLGRLLANYYDKLPKSAWQIEREEEWASELATFRQRPWADSEEVRASLLKAETATVFAALPYDADDGELRFNAKRKLDASVGFETAEKPLEIGQDVFYQPGRAAAQGGALIALLTAESTYGDASDEVRTRYPYGDYAVGWTDGEVDCSAIICFGTNEVIFRRGNEKVVHAIRAEAIKPLKAELAAYDDLRPGSDADLYKHRQRPVAASEDVRASLQTAEDAVVYLALPYAAGDTSDERQQIRYELELWARSGDRVNPIHRIDRHAFYWPGRAMEKQSALRTLLSAAASFRAEPLAGRDVLPYGDYAVAWVEGEVACAAIVCFGTSEVIFRRGDALVVHGLQAEAAKALRAELAGYDDLRIDPEALERKAEDALGTGERGDGQR